MFPGPFFHSTAYISSPDNDVFSLDLVSILNTSSVFLKMGSCMLNNNVLYVTKNVFEKPGYITTGRKTNSRMDKLSMATNCRMDFSSPTYRRKQEKQQLVEMSIVNSTNCRTKIYITFAKDYRPSLPHYMDTVRFERFGDGLIENVHC